MDTMSRSPALNPASTPFFPGGFLSKEDMADGRSGGVGFRVPVNREQFSTSTSSLSISPSEYRSVKSSPSPSQDGRDGKLDNGPQNQSPGDISRGSPAIGQVEAERGFPPILRTTARETSMSAILETIPDGDENPASFANGIHTHNALYTTVMSRNRERLNTPPVVAEFSSRTSSFNNPPLMSSSPASSLDSGSMFTPSIDLPSNFEAQLKSSPLIGEILDRLVRFEATTRKIQRDLGDVHHKVDMLLERSISANSAPEFRDPFAPTATPSFSTSGLNGPRGSIIGNIGNIAPNQGGPGDEITTISHRLNSLSTSVDQLLALSTQQMQANVANLQIPGFITSQQGDLSSGRTMGPPLSSNAALALGHNLPGRQDLRPTPRMPNPPMRTWSAGTLDLASRGSESGPPSLGRPDTIFRDKRRSVSTLLRRDSTGVRIYILMTSDVIPLLTTSFRVNHSQVGNLVMVVQ